MWTRIKQFFSNPPDDVLPRRTYYPNGSEVRPLLKQIRTLRPVRQPLRKTPSLEMRKKVIALEQGGAVLIPCKLVRQSYKNHHTAYVCLRRHAEDAGFQVSIVKTGRGELFVRRKG